MERSLSRPSSPSVVVLSERPASPSEKLSPSCIPDTAARNMRVTSESPEAREVNELVELLARDSLHSPSKRSLVRGRRRQPTRLMSAPEDIGKGTKTGDIGPGWNSTPHRNRPTALRGLNSVSDEPWKRSEELNYGRDAHIEWRTNHKNLYRHGAVPDETFSHLQDTASQKSQQMGNRLLNRQARQAAAKRRAELAAIKAAHRAEEEAMLLQLEGLRQEWEVMMVDEARAEDEALERKQREQRAVQERLEAQAKAVQEAEAADAAWLAADERLRLEAEEGAALERQAEERRQADAVRFDDVKAKSRETRKKEAFMHRSVASQRMSVKTGSKARRRAKS